MLLAGWIKPGLKQRLIPDVSAEIFRRTRPAIRRCSGVCLPQDRRHCSELHREFACKRCADCDLAEYVADLTTENRLIEKVFVQMGGAPNRASCLPKSSRSSGLLSRHTCQPSGRWINWASPVGSSVASVITSEKGGPHLSERSVIGIVPVLQTQCTSSAGTEGRTRAAAPLSPLTVNRFERGQYGLGVPKARYQLALTA